MNWEVSKEAELIYFYLFVLKRSMFHQPPNLREGRQSIHHESSLPGGEKSFEVVFPQRWGSENSKCAVQDPYSSDLILTPRGGTNLGFGFAETSQRCWVPPWGSL